MCSEVRKSEQRETGASVTNTAKKYQPTFTSYLGILCVFCARFPGLVFSFSKDGIELAEAAADLGGLVTRAGGIEPILRGAGYSRTRAVDTSFTSEIAVSSALFNLPVEVVHRGRDHGMWRARAFLNENTPKPQNTRTYVGCAKCIGLLKRVGAKGVVGVLGVLVRVCCGYIYCICTHADENNVRRLFVIFVEYYVPHMTGLRFE